MSITHMIVDSSIFRNIHKER